MTNFKAIFALSVFCFSSAMAVPDEGRDQQVQGAIGVAAFPDESWNPHTAVGVSARFYLTRRFAVEPQFLYARASEFDQDYIFIPNFTYDFRDRQRQVVPYLTGGIGLLHHRGGFGSANGFSAGAGLGIKIFVSEKAFVAPELRLGWEPFLQVTGIFGLSF